MYTAQLRDPQYSQIVERESDIGKGKKRDKCDRNETEAWWRRAWWKHLEARACSVWGWMFRMHWCIHLSVSLDLICLDLTYLNYTLMQNLNFDFSSNTEFLNIYSFMSYLTSCVLYLYLIFCTVKERSLKSFQYHKMI